MEIESILATFPKTRPHLEPAQSDHYVEEIKINRGESGGLLYNALVWLESWMHKKIAKNKITGSILEIGAGTLNHVPYEQSVTHYDIVEPMEPLFVNSPHRNKVRTRYADISEVPTENTYDSIVTIAALEHIENLPECVARAALRLKKDGRLLAGIPSEGGFLWGLSWRFTTGLAYRFRTGMSYAKVMRYEHINTASEITAIVSYFFEDVKIKRFPFPFLHFSFYTYTNGGGPKYGVATDYLKSLGRGDATKLRV